MIANNNNDGLLLKQGHYNKTALKNADEIIRQVKANSIETIRLLFADQHGILRGKTITSRVLPSIFSNGLGVPSTLLLKDTAHRTVFPVWQQDVELNGMPLSGAGDVLMVPDPECFYPLPWSPHSAILLCDVVHRDGSAIAFSSRAVLRTAISNLSEAGYKARFGLEVEFQVFERVDSSLNHEQATMPPAPVQTRNFTQGYQFLTETRYAEAEVLLDHLRRMAEKLGLAPRTMEIEMGPGQFEFTFDASDPFSQADRFLLFRTMVKEVCYAQGLHATFMAKPKLPNAAANGWHIHQSLTDIKSGDNVFIPGADQVLSKQANSWIAGLLQHASAACLMTNPSVNSYKRFTPFQLAPKHILWGKDNRGAMIRALTHSGNPASRIENRVADTSANPHYAFAAQLLTGLDGINKAATAPPATELPYDGDAQQLPQSLGDAIDAFEASELFRQSPGSEFVRYLVQVKRAEWDRYLSTVSEWEQSEYFNLY